MFFYEVEGHMPKLSSFGRGKTIRPKKSLTSFLHAALQLLNGQTMFDLFKQSEPAKCLCILDTVKIRMTQILLVQDFFGKGG